MLYNDRRPLFNISNTTAMELNFGQRPPSKIISKAMEIIKEKYVNDTAKRKFNFHLIDQNRHYYMGAEITTTLDIHRDLPSTVIKIMNINILSYQDVRNFLKEFPNQEGFLNDLKSFSLINNDEPEVQKIEEAKVESTPINRREESKVVSSKEVVTNVQKEAIVRSTKEEEVPSNKQENSVEENNNDADFEEYQDEFENNNNNIRSSKTSSRKIEPNFEIQENQNVEPLFINIHIKVIRGMLGHREEAHKVDLNLLKEAVLKKAPALRRLKNAIEKDVSDGKITIKDALEKNKDANGQELYFKVIDKNNNHKVLLIVIKHFVTEISKKNKKDNNKGVNVDFCVFSAYYKRETAIKSDLKLKDSNDYNRWLETRPKIGPKNPEKS